MSDLSPLLIDPEDADSGVIGEEEDPWPGRCEALALLLAAVLAFLVLSAALVAAGIPLGGVGPSGQGASVALRLRYASQDLSPFDGLVALAGRCSLLLMGSRRVSQGAPRPCKARWLCTGLL
jgi:hypothetical protein